MEADHTPFTKPEIKIEAPRAPNGPLGEALSKFSRAEIVLKLANDKLSKNGGVPTSGLEEVLSALPGIEEALDGYTAAFRCLRAEALRARQASLNDPKKSFMAMDDVVERAPMGNHF